MTAEGQQMPFLDQKVAEKLAAELARSMRARVDKKLGIDTPREKSVTEQMEEIMGQLRKTLREKEETAKSILDSSSDKGLLSQKKLSLFLDYLAESWRNAEDLFKNKNIEGLQFILNEVQVGEAIESKLEKVIVSEEDEKFSKESEEAEKIMTELRVVISEKKALFQAESTKVSASSEVLTRNVAYLDRLTSNAQVASSAGDMRKLRTVLKWAKKAQFQLDTSAPIATRKPEGTIPDVDASKIVSPYVNLSTAAREEPVQAEEEKTYEELEDLLDPAEQWSISGIVGDTLGTVLIYSRKKGKLKRDIIDEMGGMDFVAEKILMPAIQKVLPSEWSEDDKKFYSRESALDHLDLFVEEDKEETKK